MERNALAELETTLFWLRWCAVAGQAIALLAAGTMLGLMLDWHLLAAGVAVLALANAALGLWRSIRPVGEVRALVGLCVDLAALTWALFHSGGVMNPFTMLYLVPVALTATVLPPSRVVALGLAGVACYALLGQWAAPLPHVHGQSAFDLHLAGMGVNFVLSMVLLSAFGLRLAHLLRRDAADLRGARERGLRDEAMHAMALQTALAAHSVNTPLATLTLLVEEMRAGVPAQDEALHHDLDLAAGQLELARQALRSLGDASTDRIKSAPLCHVLDDLAERAALLRPAVALEINCAQEVAQRPVCVQAVLMASLGNLLDNAAEASQAAGSSRISMTAEADGAEMLCLRILDRGPGLNHVPSPGATDKDFGLGWGLALANATLEHHGGELHQRPREGGGTESRVRLPWRSLKASD